MKAAALPLPLLRTFQIRVIRAFKALDDGHRKKWVLVVAAKDLPKNLPLDANARLPNVIKNKTCADMRETLLKAPDLFQIFNGGIVCTATSVEAKQDGNAHVVEIGFDPEALQGVVNGGHTYATLLHVLHDYTAYSDGKDLKTVLASDVRGGTSDLVDVVEDDDKLADRVARAREKAYVQIEVVAPVTEFEMLSKIAWTRNLSQSVEATALANLAGKFEKMKSVLASAPAPFGPRLVERVVWKTNQEVPEDSKSVPVKLLIQLLAMMNIRIYPPRTRVANDVYSRAGIVVRDFCDAEGESERFYDALTALLPEFITLYDHIYQALPQIDPTYPWADGKLESERKRRRAAASTPVLALPCESKVYAAFVWPIYAAFRILLAEQPDGTVAFQSDPVAFFDEMKDEMVTVVKSFHQNQAHGLVHQVGKDKEVWVRLEERIQTEMKIRERLAAVK